MSLVFYTVLFFSIIITTFNRGFFSFEGVGILIILFVILIFLFFNKQKEKLSKLSHFNILSYILVISYTLFLFFSGGIYQTQVIPTVFLSLLPFFSFPIILTYLKPFNILSLKERKYRICFLFILAIILRFLIIAASPQPIIDVFTMLKEGPTVLLQGKNPYEAIFSPVYQGVTTDNYTYWPASFLLQMPFIFLFHDPRILLLLADIFSAILLFLLGNRTKTAELLSLIYLFRPNSNFIIEQSWLAPLEFFLIVVAIYLYKLGKKYEKTKKAELISSIVLGLLGGIQPHFLLIFPFLLFLFSQFKKNIFIYISVFLLTVLPFFFWNPKSFVSDTIGFFLRPINEMITVPIHMSLNLNTLYYLITRQDIPLLFSGILFLFVLLVIFFSLIKIKQKITKDGLCSYVLLGMTILYYSLFLLLPYSFINYYYFASGLLILWLVEKTKVINESNS